MPLSRTCSTLVFLALFFACTRSGLDPETAERLQELRNLGKAFYENPTGSEQAVETLRAALELNPNSVQEKINYSLALLRAGSRDEGIAGLEEAQRLDPTIPHTWFNLGVEYKQLGDNERALPQFEGMAELDPDEAKTQYNLGQIYRQSGRDEEAREKFERAAELDPSLGAPHFQLFNLLRRADDQAARAELEEFQRIKQLQDETGLTEDVNWSFYSELYDPVEPGEPADFVETVVFESSSVGSVVGPGDVLLLDADHDGNTDVLAWSASALQFLQGDGGRLTALDQPELTDGWSDVRRAAAGDPDNDGFPDLCLATGNGLKIASNDGGSFDAVIAVDDQSAESCLWHDYDHDGDHDLFALGEQSRLYRYASNPDQELAEGLEPVEFPFGSHGAALDAIAVELFEDNGLDLVVAYEDAIRVHQDRKLGVYGEGAAVSGSALGAGPVRLEAADLNSDGYLDVSATTSGETLVLRNVRGRLQSHARDRRALAWADTQNRGWRDLLSPSGVGFNEGRFVFSDGVVEGLPSDLVSARALDFTGDGRLDLAVVDASGGIHVAANQTATANHWIALDLTGVKSRILGSDARVEVKAGLLYGKTVYPGYPIVFGLGRQDAVETVRVTWPNGLIQNESEQDLDQALAIEEKPRLSGSCPMIYTWNGREFEYISEVLGVAPLGASLGDGRYFPVDHDEYVLLRGDQLVERDGVFEVRVTEELREVAFIDQVRLIAVDRPAGVELHTSEKFKAPPFPQLELYSISEAQKIRPVRAIDQSGHDVLAKIARLDRSYVDGFRRTFNNTAELHSLTLDLAGLRGDRRSMLFLNGWVDWAAASTIVARSQTADGGMQPPILQVRDDNGDWKTIDADPGLPGGNPRTMVVDLSGKFLSDAREVRIVTNMCVYWDEIFAVDGVETPVYERRELALASAQLRFRGFSQNIVHPQRLEPEKFVYSKVSATTSWDPTPGRYTDYGAVDDLLGSIDDQFVIMAAGDELQLRFRADLQPPGPGLERQYLLFFDGWAKEHDPNTAFGDSVEPWPFHRMSGYPYGADEVFPQRIRQELERRTNRPALRLNRPLYSR